MHYIFLITGLFLFINVSADIVGKAEVTDGDTIIINDTRIRFTGSDAPESYFFGKTQTCLDAKGKEGMEMKQLKSSKSLLTIKQ